MAKTDKGLARDFRIDRAKIDVEKRTVELAFSSETPVERWGENEVLSHDKGDCDLARLNDSHPLLLGHDEHDPMSQIGVIESARVDSDKVGRAVVRFSKGARASEIFQDVQDGIRQLVSVGYDRTGIVSSEKAADGRVTTRYRWMPTHIAIVPVPADTKAGVGRDKSEPAQVDSPQTPITNDTIMANEAKPEVLDEKTIRSQALKTDAERRKQIRTAADLLIKDRPDMRERLTELATEACENPEANPKDFESTAMREIIRTKPAKQLTPADIGHDERDAEGYSLTRAIQNCITRNESTPDPETLEGDAHVKLSQRNLGFAPEGFVVPPWAKISHRAMSRSDRRRMSRDMQVGIFGQGGATVATELYTPIIEILRNKMVTDRLGVQTLAGLEGNVVIPRQTGAGTAYAVSEIAALTVSDQTIDQIAVAPHRIGAQGKYSKQLLLQSSLDVESFVRDDLLKVIAILWDRIVLNGAGAGDEPAGILNTPGIGSIIFNVPGTPTYAELVKFKTQVATANADVGEMAFVSSPAVEGNLRGIAKLLAGATTVAATALWEGPFGPDSPDGVVAGFRAASTNQVANNQVYFGVFSEVIRCLWGGLDVVINPYSEDTNAKVRITLNTWGDLAIRHPQCFCVSANNAA